MKQIIYIVLGAILATFGGFLHIWFQSRKNRQEKERTLLIKVHDILSNYDKENYTPVMSVLDSVKIMDELCRISFKIRSKKYKDLKKIIFDFGKNNRNLGPCDICADPHNKNIIKEIKSILEPELIYYNQKGRKFRMKKSQRIILCVWLILSSVLLWLRGISIANEGYDESYFYYCLIGTAAFFAGLFVLTLKRKDKK